MAVSLTFDADGCYRALVQELIKVADSIMAEFYDEAIAGLDAQGKEDSERVNAIWVETQGYVEAKCKFYANALMQSFGTGSNSDISDSSYWFEYEHSELFNQARQRRTYIAGRPEGKYTDIFGEEQYSSGKNAGKNLEYIYIKNKDGETVQIKPLIPKFSIQNAENWLLKNHQRRVEDRIEEEVQRFFAEKAKDFFIVVSV